MNTTLIEIRSTQDEEGGDDIQNLPEGVYIDELGRVMAPIEMLVPFDENPRVTDDFDPEKSAAFRSLLNSIAQVNVREPIPVYREAIHGVEKLRMRAGHRRKAAVEQINNQRDEAYRGLIENGELTASDPRPIELQPIEFLPVAIGEKPESPFDLHADMFLAESQRLKWRIDLTLPFFKKTYDAVPALHRDDPDWLAARLGIPAARARLLTAVVNSKALYEAATSQTDQPLPQRGREKTLRSINRAAEVLFKYRDAAARRITGRAVADEEMLERLRALMVEKASVVAANHPAGVYMERLAPRLKDPQKHSDEELQAWAAGQIAVIEFVGAPTTVGATTSTRSARAATLSDVVRGYVPSQLGGLSDEELNQLSGDIAEAGNSLDAAVAAIRTELRARQLSG